MKATAVAATPAAADLDSRIIAAFADAATSADFPLLIADVEAAAKAANEKATGSKETALDPLQPPAEAASARREMHDATFLA